MSEANKIFPLRLPPNFHGPYKDRIKPIIAYKQRLQQWQNPQIGNTKISNWERKRFNSDVARQRKQFIVHPAKISEDTPNWFQTTHNYFRRNEMPSKIKSKTNDQRTFDVFNRQRANMYKIHGDNMTRSDILDRKYSITDKIGGRQESAHKKFVAMHQQVSPKVGSVEKRNFEVRKPQLKIGKSGHVDTYTPF